MRYLQYSFIIIMTLFYHLTFSQPGDWIWGNNFGSSGSEVSNSIDTDGTGNIYLSGNFDSPTIYVDTHYLINNGYSDVLLIKCDPDGNPLWAKNFGGFDDDYSGALCVDESGNIYLSGYYYSDTIDVGGIVLSNSGDLDIFLAKYDTDGNLLWAKRFGSIGEEVAKSIALSPDGNICFTGMFDSPNIEFDDITLSNTNAGRDEIFVLKFDPSGNIIWAQNAQGTHDDISFSVAVDHDCSVLISGSFRSTNITFGPYTLNNFGSFDVFLAKYDSEGNVLWLKGSSGTKADYGYGVAVDSEGYIYSIGIYESVDISFDNYLLINHGNYDIFIVKYHPEGTVLWAKGWGGSSSDRGLNIYINQVNEIFACGYFNSYFISFDEIDLISYGNLDGYLMSISPDGDVLWANSYGGMYKDKGRFLSSQYPGSIIFNGEYASPSINFNDIIVTNNYPGKSDIFLTKLAYNVIPYANFNYTVDGLQVQFINQSQYTTSYLWDFGDGTGSSEKNPTHYFSDYGEYEVTLIAFVNDTSDTTFQIINVCLMPLADFDYFVDRYKLNLVNKSLNADSYYWNFGDGYFSTLKNPTYTYSDEGEYLLQFIAQNNCGSDSASVIINICDKPMVDFDYTQNNFKVSFINTSINFDTCLWYFGDGYGTSIINPVHSFAEEGDYDVMLVAFNECGADTVTKTISISLSPLADFSYYIDEFDLIFYNNSVNAISFHWDFGDNNSSNLEEPVHTYEEVGEYIVTLIATNDYSSDTVSYPVMITGINIYDDNNMIILYPNPATDRIYLEFSHISDGNINLELYNHLGQLILKKEIRLFAYFPKYELDLSTFEMGMYYLRITNNQIFYSRKIIIY